MTHSELERMQVLGIRYRRTACAVQDERGLDAYLESGVYESARIPSEYCEPRIEPTECSGDAVADLGVFNGRIAETAAAARRAGAVLLMTGGDCSHATGIVGGLQDAHGPGLRLGLVWFDAHGDFNTPHTSTSGMLGGMPVAVCAGLAHPAWREGAHIVAPMPTERILLVDVRNLDPAEETLIRGAGVATAMLSSGSSGVALPEAIDRLAQEVDAIYLHIDADILDARLVPSHGTQEPNGPDVGQTCTAIDRVMATGKVVALALVSIYNQGEDGKMSVKSGVELLRCGLGAWQAHGTAHLPLV